MKAFLALLVVLSACASAQPDFSQERALATLRHLVVDIGPRPMGSPAEQEALRYAVEEFRSAGCDTAYIMPMTVTSTANTTSGIAVGVKRGQSMRMIVVGGHIDSEGPEVPGADDDGSGSAAVIELARVFAHRATASTIVFCCFGGEEQGLRGSRHFVDEFPFIDSVNLMVQLDMANGLGTLNIDPNTAGRAAPRWLTSAAVEEFRTLGYDHLLYPTHFFSMNYASPFGSGSDHESFLQRGIPAIDFSTDVGKPIHTPRDNFENFEPDGLRRSGMLAQRLVERFDAGTPGRTTEQYWLFLLGTTPIMIPYWGLWIYVGGTVVLAALALATVHRRRAPKEVRRQRRWSTLKLMIFALLIASSGWFSADLVGLLRGLRHPWFTSVDLFILQAALGSLLGLWGVIQVRSKLPITVCPYAHFLRAAVLLVLLTLVCGLLDLKLAVEPVSALLLVSLAMLLRPTWVKVVLLALSPVWVFRLIFNEWRDLLFREFASANTSLWLRWLSYNGGFILFFALVLLPFLLAGAAVIRDCPSMGTTLLTWLQRPRSLGVAGLMFVALTGYLLTVPVYDRLWYRSIRIDERYNMDSRLTTVNLRGTEFLSGVRVSHGGRDTLLNSRSILASILPDGGCDPTWVRVERREERNAGLDSASHSVELRLKTFRRPYSVTVKYALNGLSLPHFDSPWTFSTERAQTVLRWFSFPDSVLTIPVRFSVPRADSVLETIAVEFDSLSYPMRVEQEKAYMLPRTTYTTTTWYTER